MKIENEQFEWSEGPGSIADYDQQKQKALEALAKCERTFILFVTEPGPDPETIAIDEIAAFRGGEETDNSVFPHMSALTKSIAHAAVEFGTMILKARGEFPPDAEL